MAVFDAMKDEMIVVTPVRPAAGQSTPQTAYDARASSGCAASSPRSTSRCRTPRAADRRRSAMPEPVSNTTPARVSRRWWRRPRSTSPPATSSRSCCPSASRRPSTLPPFALYRALRRTNPSPFLFYLDFGGFALVGSSPEILVRVRDGEVTIRPIAGTRPRGDTPEEDQALEEELLADPKERAEHLMLLDLGRNDVGRVAEIGTVQGHRELLPSSATATSCTSSPTSSARSTTKHDASTR